MDDSLTRGSRGASRSCSATWKESRPRVASWWACWRSSNEKKAPVQHRKTERRRQLVHGPESGPKRPLTHHYAKWDWPLRNSSM